ncbi:MAG: tRNA adenosine(34) deaminase TadA [Clostridiales bacterium]|nr:tRNA adenosine(34) deaminase TadA [Clostridiales bacterium]
MSEKNENNKSNVCVDKPEATERDEKYMRLALAALDECPKVEVPVAAIVVCGDEVVGVGVNRRETDVDPTAHAEVVAIRAAAKKLGRWNMSDCELFVTLEPCVMCAGAIVYSRIPRVVYGAKDIRFGACGSALDVTSCEKLNHRAKTVGGVLEQECLAPIQAFFKARRGKN